MRANNQEEGFKERRIYHRFLLETFGRIGHGMNFKSEECYIQNIGPGGAMLFVSHDMKVHDVFTLDFKISSRKFKKKFIIKSIRNFSEKRRFVLQIGKSLDFTSSANISFEEPLTSEEIEFIKLNYLKDQA